ncbi:MAG: hypothetical protein IJ726_08875 [Phocaeicola sp.]|nr:hypothetical protein [Phocaeicola sp.]
MNCMSTVIMSSRKMVQASIDEVDDGMSILKGLMELDGFEDPVIRPVFDSSEVEDGMRRLDAMLPNGSYRAASYADRDLGRFSESTTQIQNGGDNITVILDWKAGATPNQVVRQLANELEIWNSTKGS